MTQEDMMLSAHARLMVRIHTFNEIQSGPNPLSKEELEVLAKKNPRVWAQFTRQ